MRNKKPGLPLPLLHILSPVCTALFIMFLALMVRTQIRQSNVAIARMGLFLMFMAIIAVCVVALSIWSLLSRAYATNMICALGILVSIASCYQLLFSYGDFCLSVWGSVMVGLLAYQIWRRINYLNTPIFLGVCILNILMMLALYLFGENENGAKLSISILGLINVRPGEIVKLFTILLGSCAYPNDGRKTCYCAATLICCALFLLCNDLGGAVLLFALFVLMTYMLYDNRGLSLSIIAAAAFGLFFLLFVADFAPHAKQRFLNWFHAMANNPQQHKFIRAVLLGGFGGLGLENSHLMTDIFAASHDGALPGVMAVYGVPMTLLVMGSYAMLAVTPVYNRSVHPSGYLILVQMSTYIACHSLLNMAGGLDLLPFTGIVAPVVSAGKHGMLCFGALIGVSFAAIHPITGSVKEV